MCDLSQCCSIYYRYLDERHKYLGPDLATAHFITARGGSIKFVGNDNWFYTEKNKYTHELPKEFTAGWFVEAIDASGMPIMYDSMANLGEVHACVLCSSQWCLIYSYIHVRTCIHICIFEDWIKIWAFVCVKGLTQIETFFLHSMVDQKYGKNEIFN